MTFFENCLFLMGMAALVGVVLTIRRGRIASPIIWTGVAGGLVFGLSLAVFDVENTGHTALILGYIYGILGAAIGYFTDMLVEDGKAAR